MPPEDNLKLESVVVTAKEASNAMATSRTIGGNAIDHLQMVNASDISALRRAARRSIPT